MIFSKAFMVTVNEAKQKINSETGPNATETRLTAEAVGYVLAADIAAPLSMPSFRQSSMDGYAILHSDISQKDVFLKITGESRAGQAEQLSLISGQAIRIFTGAPVPN